MTNGSESPRLPQRQPPSGLALTGFLIALSFVAMIVPLALFHAAQVAAAIRLRTALGLTLLSASAILALGLLFGLPSLAVGGLGGLIWFPVFALVLWQRSQMRPIWLSAMALSFPIGFLMLGVFFSPGASQMQEAIKLMSSQTGPMALEPLQDLVEFARLGRGERLAWLVFGKGISWSLATVGVCLSNLFFLDLAFEQVERLKALARFALQNPGAFSPVAAEGLLAVVNPEPRGRGELLEVASVRRMTGEAEVSLLSFLLKPCPPRSGVRLMGYEFEFRSVRARWNLRRFSLPLPLVLGAVAVLSALLFAAGSSEAVVIWARSRAWVGPLSISALVLLTVVAVQGLVVALERLTPSFLVMAVLLFLLASAFVSANAFVLLGLLGAVGILDYAYGFRGQLAKSPKAV